MQELIYSNKTVLLPPNLCQSWIATDTDFIAALRLNKMVESLYNMSVHQSRRDVPSERLKVMRVAEKTGIKPGFSIRSGIYRAVWGSQHSASISGYPLMGAKPCSTSGKYSFIAAGYSHSDKFPQSLTGASSSTGRYDRRTRSTSEYIGVCTGTCWSTVWEKLNSRTVSEGNYEGISHLPRHFARRA